MVAATADLAGLIVLHFDKDFDLIREVTGQPDIDDYRRNQPPTG